MTPSTAHPPTASLHRRGAAPSPALTHDRSRTSAWHRLTLALALALSLVLVAAGVSPAKAAAVKRSVTLTQPGAVFVGTPFAIYGQLSKSGRGASVAIYQKTGSGDWTKSKVIETTDARGNFIYKTTLSSTAEVAFQARAPKSRSGATRYRPAASRPVVVTPQVTYAQKYLTADWQAFDGSSSPGFSGDYTDGTYGYEARFYSDDAVGTRAYITWDLQDKCTTGSLRLGSASGGIFGSDIRFDVEADGVLLLSVTMGEDQERVREIDTTDRSKLTVSATFLGGDKTGGAAAVIYGDSYLTCESTL